jgi:putative acetyltransferase
LRVFVDPDLLQYDEVWAAAGTWNDVFPITPNDLVRASGGAVTDLKRGSTHAFVATGKGLLTVIVSLMTVVISTDSPAAADVQVVLRRHWAFLDAPKHTVNGFLPTPDANHYLTTKELLAPAVSFFSARENGSVVAIGAIVEIGDGHGEIKSMHTVAERRGQGLGRKMLVHLIGVARERRFARVSLETGSMPEFAPAHALYASLGFIECEPFASYEASVHSKFMTRSIDMIG